jgi:hypothetical protein
VTSWVADEFEGRAEWVPTGRLKCLWSGLETFRAREARWDALLDASETGDSPGSSAASTVFDKLIDPRLAVMGWEGRCTTVTIPDPEALAMFLDASTDSFASELSFIEDGWLVAPWAIARSIAARAASRDPDPILRYVEKEEAKARDEALHGRYVEWRGEPPQLVPPERCQEYDAEHCKPCRDILRAWCGAAELERWDEAKALREELAHVTGILDKAIDALRRAGETRAANAIDRELGRPVGAKRKA